MEGYPECVRALVIATIRARARIKIIKGRRT